ncbi:HAD-IIB family hydrolase [Roseicitreum antarcticum]|uniref:HAD-superfamily hydrolase, subfamily IIB n=1 Tax=Roseicitreum antarcticum TaxID=564137 RepID=A0A1H2RQK0_9RHOB|nr:HAD-IIB family hydrolase [Roseicitreum antarcticum]SDW21430.1 HAD-superfamily hydrolase, subfamily IIB [Roseicitreum antarcticum]
MTQTQFSSGAEVRRDMVLATDLDGTFLGGSDADRKRLYAWLRDMAPDVRLIFVTGRDPAFIADLCRDGFVPTPEYVIGDVGTTIARVVTAPGKVAIEPITALEAEISATWADCGDRARALLRDTPGMWEQSVPFRYRLSYQYDATFRPETVDRVRELGVDVLISHGCFVDILPKGISKGPSLLRLLGHLSIPQDTVLVAGDTLNDLSMFQTGLHGAVVGGAEAELLAATKDLPRALHCTAIGAAGIIEAIHAHNLHPTPPEIYA